MERLEMTLFVLGVLCAISVVFGYCWHDFTGGALDEPLRWVLIALNIPFLLAALAVVAVIRIEFMNLPREA